MSDWILFALIEVAFFVSLLLVGVWLQLDRKPVWLRVIGALLTVLAFGLGLVSVVRLIDQLLQ